MTMFLTMKSTARLSVLKKDTPHLFPKTRNTMWANIRSHKRKHNCIVTQTRQLSQKNQNFPYKPTAQWLVGQLWAAGSRNPRKMWICSFPAITGQSAGDNKQWIPAGTKYYKETWLPVSIKTTLRKTVPFSPVKEVFGMLWWYSSPGVPWPRFCKNLCCKSY